MHTGEQCAKLFMFNSKLPLALADAINKSEYIEVSDVYTTGNDACIRLWSNMQSMDLLIAVCRAICQVYNTNVSVSDA